MEMLPATSNQPAVRYEYFPTQWQAVLFRNWGIAPVDKLCAVLKASEAQLRDAAREIGLDPDKNADPTWTVRGYLTMIRENWHLLTFEQITTLLDISAETLAFLLKEDDFLWHKMGQIKPLVEAPRYRPLTEAEAQRTREIAAYIQNAAGGAWKTDNAFEFVKYFTRPLTEDERAQAKAAVVPGDELRTVYSYFALYGDPLMNPDLDPFPEALLAEYAKMGVKGVWMQGILYQLVEFPFAPEMSNGCEIRMKNLKLMIERAARYGIGIYLYLNEPRSMSAAFFEKYPELRGTREGDFYAMCTSQPQVQAYLEDAMKRLFAEAKGLKGFFTITMSENLTNCYSRGRNTCPRCSVRKPWEVVAEVNNIMARGAHQGNPDAKAIAWNWAWGDDWCDQVAPLLTENQIVQCTSEERLETRIGGVEGYVVDYTLSLCGPREKAKKVWASALKNGLTACAKVQFNNSWEMSAVPWMPVFDKVAGHVKNLMDAGVSHLQYSWTLGGYPSPNLKLASYLMSGKGDVRSFTHEWLGDDLGETAYLAQKRMSEAFTSFPFNIGVLYVAPQNYGPMAPFFLEKTGWKATMIGFPYDDLDSWRAIYPREIFETQFAQLVAGWQEGVAIMEAREGECAEFDDMLNMARGALIHFASTLHQIQFVRCRDEWKVDGSEEARREMLSVIEKERGVVISAIQLRAKDARIGYEASNHYYYSMQDLCEKLINLKWCEEQLGR